MTHSVERTATWIKHHCLDAVDERYMRWARGVYEWLLSAATLGRGVPRLINGEDEIRVSVHHRYVDESYEPEVFDLLKRELKHDDIVFDVGAYIGVYSIILARYLGPKGGVYAFEPAPDNARLLQEHLKLNRVCDKVKLVSAGVGEACGRGKLYANGEHIQNSFSEAALGEHAGVGTIDVAVVSLDAFCDEHSLEPSWVKVDTEGWELQVLRGATGLFGSNRNVRFVVEMHPYAWQTAGYDAQTFEQFCAEHSLRVTSLSNQKEPFGEYGQVLISVDD
jgi:FkbM family methyltransferase